MTLLRIFARSEQIGFAGTIFVTVAGLSLGSVLAVAVSRTTIFDPITTTILALLLTLPVGFGGLVGYWLISAHITYLQCGYRVCWVSGDEWRYEERIDGRSRSLPLVRKIIGRGYPAPSEVQLPDSELWQLAMPDWARDRRAEIVERIGKCFGDKLGSQIVFKE